MNNPTQKHRPRPAGSSIVELIIVTILFAIFVPISLGIYIGGRKITGQSYVQHAAALALTETTDILEYMRNENFDLLENGSFYLIRNPGNNSWLIKSDVPDKDTFERYITVSDAWRHGNSAPNNNNPPIEPLCLPIGNIDMYVPLSPGASGTYPAKGKNADTATVNQSVPISNGYVNVNLSFNGVPANFKNAVLYITFEDLDLKEETATNGANKIGLSETFSLMDKDSNVLQVLDASYPGSNSAFTWQTNLPDNLFNSTTLDLIAKFFGKLRLITGTTYTLVNARDNIKNIKICGEIHNPPPATCNIGDDCSNNLYLDNDVGTSYTDPDTKKVEIQILWAPDYIPLDLISRTFYISNWQSDFTYPSS